MCCTYPGHQLDEVGREGNSGLGIEDARVRVTVEIPRDNLIFGIIQNPLHRALRGSLEGSLDLVVTGALLEAACQVHHGDIGG